MTAQGIPANIKLNPDQQAAFALAKSNAHKHHLFHGPAGSGKSFFIMWLVLSRAIIAPRSRHAIFRLTRASCEQTLFDKTLYEVLDGVWPGLRQQCKVSLSSMSVELPNGSVVFFCGLDEQRLTKVLGDEFNTIWMNECNEFQYSHVSTVLGRLRWRATKANGKPLANKMFYDCNPRWKGDWEYQAFIRNVIPGDNEPLPNASKWVEARLETLANQENLPEDYIDDLRAQSRADRRRYLEGIWSDQNENGMWDQEWFDKHRLLLPEEVVTPEDTLEWLAGEEIELERLTIAVDPATTSKATSDLNGITAQALARNGNAYVLADLSQRASPDVVCQTVVQAFKAWGAARVVMEKNAGGDWLESLMRKYHERIPITLINADSTTGSKASRAEPVSAEYERGKVWHVGNLKELEEQMLAFDGPHFRGSPDRMDAAVWGITELFNLHNAKRIKPGAVILRAGNRRR